MGGLLFNTERLPKEKFQEIKNKVQRVLSENRELPRSFQYFFPLYYRSKKDFGDLDVVCSDNLTVDQVLKMFHPDKHFVNGSIVSILWLDFHIDFIRVPSEHFISACYYFSWNDCSNLIGKISHRFGLKFAMEGFKYSYIDGGYKQEIIVSKDMKEIFDFLDLDLKKYGDGFETLEEIFEFIRRSKYYNPFMFDLENLNHINRERDKKRTTYKKFLDWVEPDKKLTTEWPTFKNDKTDYWNLIDVSFPNGNFLQQIHEIQYQKAVEDLLKSKFNGKTILDRWPEFPNKLIAKFKEEFQNHIENSKRVGFKAYLIKSNENQITLDLNIFYNTKWTAKTF